MRRASAGTDHISVFTANDIVVQHEETGVDSLRRSITFL